MVMSRSAIQTVIEASTGRTDKASLISTAIDLALEEISNDHRWRAVKFESTTLVTTASQQTVDLSSLEPFQVLSVRLIQGTEYSYLLNFISEEQFDKIIPDVTDTSEMRPVYCYVKEDTLYLGPIPDAEYSLYIRYTSHPADEAENVIKGIDAAIIASVNAFIFGSIEKIQEAQFWEGKKEKALLRAKRADKRVKHDMRPVSGGSVEDPAPWLNPFIGH